jgi:hypothetical protein
MPDVRFRVLKSRDETSGTQMVNPKLNVRNPTLKLRILAQLAVGKVLDGGDENE